MRTRCLLFITYIISIQLKTYLIEYLSIAIQYIITNNNLWVVYRVLKILYNISFYVVCHWYNKPSTRKAFKTVDTMCWFLLK